MYWAMGVEPTKPIAWTRGSSSSASTASLSPLTTLKTPSGSPASVKSSARRSGTEGSRSEGLRMKALPAASAGPDFHSGIMAGKLNGVMPATTPSGWRMECTSMPVPALVGELALEQVRGAGGELHHLDAALDVALGIREGLAVFGGQQGGELVHVLVDQVHELEQDPAAALRVHGGPFQLALFRVGDDVADFLGAGQRHLGLDLAGARIVDVAEPAGRAVHPLAANVMG